MSAQPVPVPEHPGAVLDPHARLAAALVVSLVLWAPFGMAAMRSELDLVDAGVRYLVAFLGCRLAIGGIAHLVEVYRAVQDGLGADAAPARRRDDAPLDAGRRGGPGRI